MKKCFFTGLATLLPVAVTIWIFIFFVRFLTRPFMGIMTALLEDLPKYGIITSKSGIELLSQLFILLSLFILVFCLGFIARRFFFEKLFEIGDRILYRVPLVNKVYKTSKEIIHSLFASQGGSFKQVVLIPFPYRGGYCLGLVSGPSPESCVTPIHQEMESVFIPTAPNPMTGFLVMIPRKEMIYLEMKTEEAMKYVVSCAVIKPDWNQKEEGK